MTGKLKKKVNEHTAALRDKFLTTQNREHKVEITFESSPDNFWGFFYKRGHIWNTWVITLVLLPDPKEGEVRPHPKDALRDYCFKVMTTLKDQEDPLPSIKEKSLPLCYNTVIKL
mmetsp:Transcript_81263/g.122111  ORF Transcript_81263/g.122111 Transcript_81263/m.122111 type:complete len:115 (-) Transcript_81263:42-386(-)